jgi:hypothetical protein
MAGCKKQDFDTASFRCKIDGKEFIGAKDLTTATFNSPSNIRIRTTKVKNVLKPSEPYGEMELNFSYDLSNVFAPAALISSNNIFYYGNNGGNTLRSSSTNPGVLTITSLDLSTGKITGTFSLTAYDDNSGTKQITEGGFDLTLDM